MTKQTRDDIATIAKLKVSKSILKIIIMDFHAREKLTVDETAALLKKYKLKSS